MKIRMFGIGVFAGSVLLSAFSSSAVARPEYSLWFVSVYETEFADNSDARSCRVCHNGRDWKRQNNYGDALAESLEVKRVKDFEKFKTALVKTENKPSAISGMTFGDLIREGRLPASK